MIRNTRNLMPFNIPLSVVMQCTFCVVIIILLSGQNADLKWKRCGRIKYIWRVKESLYFLYVYYLGCWQLGGCR